MRRLLTIAIVIAVLAILGLGVYVHAAAVDLQNDPNNCGAVGFRVPAGDICHNGIATPAPGSPGS